MRRPTLRTQLTLLYAVPFFASGAILITIPILRTRDTVPAGTPPPGPGVSDDPTFSPILGASLIALAGMVVVSILLGWLVAGRFLRPLRAITATAQDISASNLHRRLGPTGRGDEFTELAETLDELFARLEAAFASQRRFVANASHELRTPLTAERTLLQVALADPHADADGLRAVCRDVLALGVTQERLIDALLTLASSEQGVEHRLPFDLADLADAVLTRREQDARQRGVRLDTALATAPATGDRSLVESLVANLVDNALRHNTAPGDVRITTSTVEGRAQLTVRNTGPVVPPSELDRLFQPFQRLHGQRIGHAEGHGLGLAIVHAIANAHGATLDGRTNPTGGLTITVTF